MHGKQTGDPAKAGQIIVEAVTATGRGKGAEGYLHLPLGKDAVQRAYTKINSFSANVESVKHISESAVFDELEGKEATLDEHGRAAYK